MIDYAHIRIVASLAREELLLVLSLLLSLITRSWVAGAIPVAYLLFLRIRSLCGFLRDTVAIAEGLSNVPMDSVRAIEPQPTFPSDEAATERDDEPFVSPPASKHLVHRAHRQTQWGLPEPPVETIEQMASLGVDPETARKMVAFSQTLVPALMTPMVRQMNNLVRADPNFLSSFASIPNQDLLRLEECD
jgi:hypothetical protein